MRSQFKVSQRRVYRFLGQHRLPSGRAGEERLSEAMGLRCDQADLSRLVITIGDTAEMTPKTAHSHREVMIGEGLAQDLKTLGQEYVNVFPGFRDPSKPMGNYRKALRPQ